MRRLAELAGISPQQMRRIEAGKAEGSAISIARIARAVGQSCDVLLGDVRTVEEAVNRLWEENGLSLKLTGSNGADFVAKKAILESMKLWTE